MIKVGGGGWNRTHKVKIVKGKVGEKERKDRQVLEGFQVLVTLGSGVWIRLFVTPTGGGRRRVVFLGREYKTIGN